MKKIAVFTKIICRALKPILKLHDQGPPYTANRGVCIRHYGIEFNKQDI